MEPEVIAVVAGILWRGATILVNQRPRGGAHEGLWEFPGGKVEAGESAEQALARELREELGVTVRGMEFWREVSHTYTAPARRVHLYFYHVRAFDGEPRGCEGQQVRWVTPCDAQALPFLQADRPLVRNLCALTQG